MLKKRKTINIFYANIISLFILCIVIILINFFTKDNIKKETIVGVNPISLIKSNIVYKEPLTIEIKEKEKVPIAQEEQKEIKEEEKQENLEIQVQTQPVEEVVVTSQLVEKETVETQPIEDEVVETQILQNEQNLMQHSKFTNIGKIEIPKTGVNLPIIEQVTVDAMKEAPCLLYSTGELNKNGNNLIVGHNFRNNTIFSNNQKLNIDDKIYITTLDGSKVEYTIYDKFITTAEDVSYIKRDTNNKPEITLSCCTDDDEYRIIILAKVM